MSEKFYLLRISLLEVYPEIWRRFFVPADITLDRLHDVVQIVMGWKNQHLYEFRTEKKRYTEYRESKEDGLLSGRYRLEDLIKEKGQSILYIYDFGDRWDHEINILENDFSPSEKEEFPLSCLDGARSCPPEDVGGISGYYEFCEATKSPNHEDYDRLKEWSGGNYESEVFFVNEINTELKKYFSWSRDRYKKWLKK